MNFQVGLDGVTGCWGNDLPIHVTSLNPLWNQNGLNVNYNNVIFNTVKYYGRTGCIRQ
jgi:hypothetical protein